MQTISDSATACPAIVLHFAIQNRGETSGLGSYSALHVQLVAPGVEDDLSGHAVQGSRE